jgi:integrase
LALDILQERRRAAGLVPEGDALVFPGPATGGVFLSWPRLKHQLDTRLAARGSSQLGPVAGWVLHDLRRSFATIASRELKAADNLIDLVINHAAAKTRSLVTRTYNVNDKRDERVELMRRWNALLVALIKGRPTGDADIVPLHAHTA